MSETKKEKKYSPAYVWFDTEFTSLELAESHLLQVSMVLTDRRLQRLLSPERDVNLTVRLADDAPVSAWVQEHIPAQVAASRGDDAVQVKLVDDILCERLLQALGEISGDVNERPVLAGNSVGADMQMARKWLPKFAAMLHYRILDVSAWKIGWIDHFDGPEFDKESAEQVTVYAGEFWTGAGSQVHDAYYDVCASIAEYRYYLSQMTRMTTDQ